MGFDDSPKLLNDQVIVWVVPISQTSPPFGLVTVINGALAGVVADFIDIGQLSGSQAHWILEGSNFDFLKTFCSFILEYLINASQLVFGLA